ncbi:MAG TPA: ATP-binding protein, partial [Oligoflexia bacterium]|nr:ATP-binding protein [Oligoflexia bacterium]
HRNRCGIYIYFQCSNPLYWRKSLEQRLLEHVPFIQVVLGPRQVGKTTSILQIIKRWDGRSVYETADLPSPPDSSWIISHWERARRDLSKPVLLVLDEIQKIPPWAEVVKKLFDEDRHEENLSVVILGSASLSLGTGLTESLAGRFEINHCRHWDLEEFKDAFGWDLYKYLKFGGYPAPVNLLPDTKRWTEFIRMSTIEPVISLDILSDVQINNPALFRQTLELALSHPAKELSYQKFLGQLQERGNTSTIKGHLEILKKAFILKQIRKYKPDTISSRVSSPKIIPLCPALVSAFTSTSRVEEDLSWQGFMFEALVGAELLKRFDNVYYWRDGNSEVDFVVEKNQIPIPIEVKLDRARNKKGLNDFIKIYKNAKPLIITEKSLNDLPHQD